MLWPYRTTFFFSVAQASRLHFCFSRLADARRAGRRDACATLTSGNRRDDADFIAVFERRLFVFQEADVLLVHINVHETAHLAFFIHEAFLDAGEARLQFDNRLADGGGVDFDQLLVVGQLAERRWDSDFFWHKLNFNFFVHNRFIPTTTD